jgi:hypothetical protein
MGVIGEVVLDAPTGSSATDTSYAITPTNLGLLADGTKSALLSVSNLGSSITSRINSTLELIETLGDFTAYLLDETALNGLANGNVSSVLASSNVGTSRFVKVIVILGEIAPTAGARAEITDGTTAYELSVPTGLSEKRLEFNQIPEAFVNAFSVRNLTGVSLASSGNSIVVVGL